MTIKFALIIQAALSSLALLSVVRAGKKHIDAWYLLMLGHGIGLVYFYLTKQYLLLPLSYGMILAGYRNLLLWKQK